MNNHDSDKTNFASQEHAFCVGRVLEHLRRAGINVRPVLDEDAFYTDRIELEIGMNRQEWVELTVSPWVAS